MLRYLLLRNQGCSGQNKGLGTLHWTDLVALIKFSFCIGWELLGERSWKMSSYGNTKLSCECRTIDIWPSQGSTKRIVHWKLLVLPYGPSIPESSGGILSASEYAAACSFERRVKCWFSFRNKERNLSRYPVSPIILRIWNIETHTVWVILFSETSISGEYFDVNNGEDIIYTNWKEEKYPD